MHYSFISQECFDQREASQMVIVHDHARKYAAVQLPDCVKGVVISWRSDSVNPVLLAGMQSDIWIGIDQRVVSITHQGQTKFSIGLASHFLKFYNLEDCMGILCETELVLVNGDYSIRNIHGLTNIPDSLVRRDSKLIVKLINGNEMVIG